MRVANPPTAQAQAYGELIREMWSGKRREMEPQRLKQLIGEVAPRLHGYQQHDSQELLTFVLGGPWRRFTRSRSITPFLCSQTLPDCATVPLWEVPHRHVVIAAIWHYPLDGWSREKEQKLTNSSVLWREKPAQACTRI